MSKSWANPTWFFFHTLIEKIHPAHYLLIKDELMAHIKKICTMLPCPDCAQHATQFMRNVKTPISKEECKKMLFVFHNTVNMRVKKPLYPVEGLTMYQRVNLPVCYQLFREQFSKKTNNPKMFLDSMSRSRYIQELDTWLQKNRLI
jgi:hypothetical protein